MDARRAAAAGGTLAALAPGADPGGATLILGGSLLIVVGVTNFVFRRWLWLHLPSLGLRPRAGDDVPEPYWPGRMIYVASFLVGSWLFAGLGLLIIVVGAVEL